MFIATGATTSPLYGASRIPVKQKMNNISGLQLADLVAHPSRNDILKEQKILEKELGDFGREVIKILQHKYYQHQGKIFGKKFL